MQRPHRLLLHTPTLQSELDEQPPQRPSSQMPSPLQSELVLQPPHRLFLHVPVLQSELDEHPPHLPSRHVPWPLQSELVEQCPHVPLLQLPKPTQSELVLQDRSTGANRSSIVSGARVSTRSPATCGTATGTGLGSPPHATRNRIRTSRMRSS